MKLRRTTRFLLPLLLSCLVFAFVPVAHAEPGLQSELSAISGQGTGHVDVSPTANDQRDTVFIAQGTAEIHGALPDATYVVQRAVDFTPNDSVCTIAPSPPAGWITLTAFTTSEAGAGAGHFVRKATPPPVPQFDVIFRVVKQNDNGTLDLSQVLMSDCMTVTVK
ncbi:MAG TPA: hypothetical protein VJQ08_04865 [Candidatus Dormibacteraeota bacterium]|nr:hypothetical protein [Candidatus Dormibacteraeota bacterium]